MFLVSEPVVIFSFIPYYLLLYLHEVLYYCFTEYIRPCDRYFATIITGITIFNNIHAITTIFELTTDLYIIPTRLKILSEMRIQHLLKFVCYFELL